MVETLWDAITRRATDFIEGGQERRQWLDDLGRKAEYYVPPELRNILGFVAEATPTAAIDRAAQAGGEMLAPGRTPMQRLGSAGQMLSETASVVAPAMVANRAAMPAAQAIQESLLGASVAADDVGRRFVERINQPGPVPTMYSGPAGFADYLKRVNPRGVRVAAEDRPNLMMGDMYGMLPSGAKRVGKQGDVTFYRGREGDFYATAFNPDVGEQDVVGYIMPRGDMTELAVVDEMQGQGIGGELQYLFRKENPDAPTGGLTEVGEKALRKTYERLSSEGLLGNPVGRAADDAPKGILAYHGSPHDFDRFSMSKIGTGEGAQAYGHGLYFAEAEPVAKGYRDQISKGNTSAARRALEAADGDVDRAIQDVESKLRRLDERAALGDFGGDERRFAAQRQIQSDKIQQLKGFKETGEFNAGRMYEVNIKANPEDFLDWDKPLSEQPNILRRLGLSDRAEDEINAEAARLMEEGNAKAGRAGGWMDDPEISARINDLNDEINNLAPSVSGESFYRSGGQGGAADLMSQLGSGSPQMRSQELLEAGIPGVKYLDAGSRGAVEGSRNYVVFDENLIDIVRKYGIAGAALMLGMSQTDLAQAMQAQQPKGLLSQQEQEVQ